MNTNWISHHFDQLKLAIVKYDLADIALREICQFADLMAVDGEVDRHVKFRIAELESQLVTAKHTVRTATISLENETRKFETELLTLFRD